MSSPEDTKERLLQATLELISTRGYQGATTREIAKRAGVSELTLFRKFGNKENLFEEMLKKHTFLPHLKDLVRTLDGVPVKEALTIIGISYLEGLQSRKDLIRIILSEFNTFPDKARKAHGQFITDMGLTLEGYIRGLNESGILRSIPPDSTANSFLRVLFATFLSEEIMRGRKMTKGDVKKIVGDIVDIFLNGITAEKNSLST